MYSILYKMQIYHYLTAKNLFSKGSLKKINEKSVKVHKIKHKTTSGPQEKRVNLALVLVKAGSNQAFVSMCSSSPHKAHQQPPEMKWHLIQYSHHRQGY